MADIFDRLTVVGQEGAQSQGAQAQAQELPKQEAQEPAEKDWDVFDFLQGASDSAPQYVPDASAFERAVDLEEHPVPAFPAQARALTPDLTEPPRSALARAVVRTLDQRSQAAAEDFRSALQQPWIDPVTVGASAFAGGAVAARQAGAGVLRSLAHGAAAALPAAAMDVPIGQVTEELEQKDPLVAFLANVGLGLASGMTLEHLAQKGLLETLERAVRLRPKAAEKLLPREIFARWKQTEPSKEPSALSELAESVRPRSFREPTSDVFDKVAKRTAIRTLPPSAFVTGPVGAIATGVDWDHLEETGQIKVYPDRALAGLLAGLSAPHLYRHGTLLGYRIAASWDKRVATPFLDALRDSVNGLIVHEDLRFALGLGRSQQFQDLFREYKRDVETLWERAAEIGRELQRIAPSKPEQRRLMQVVQGSITANPEMQQKAEQVQKLFQELKEQLKEFNLIRYSRFDKLTRAERAEIRKAINRIPDPETLNLNSLSFVLKENGIDPDTVLAEHRARLRGIELAHGVQVVRETETQILRKALRDYVDFQKGRLSDYYHFGSAREYAPVFYAKHEGLSPRERKVLEDEIRELKIRSRRGNPEGSQRLEELIAELENLLKAGEKGRRAYRMQRQELVRGYAHRRLDIPREVQRIMGLIEEAPYPVAKGLGIQLTDIRKQKLFAAIADNPDWTRYILKGRSLPANFVKVENEAFGPLNGLAVRRDIWDDLREVEEWRGAFTRLWDEYLGWWKYGKVVLNPATHARNFLSNLILAYMGDVSPTDVGTYAKAIRALREGYSNQFYKEAKDWGLLNNTFYSAEINKLRDSLDSVRDGTALENWIRSALSSPAKAYEGNEWLFKMAVYIKARESGLSVDEAAKKAEKFIFNYADIPPWVKQVKRWVSPFFTFTYKAIPLFAEMAIRKPWKVGILMGGIYGLEELSREALGLSREEASEQRARMPEWMRRKAPPWIGPYTMVRMPFRDKWGDDLFLDLAYILPYGNVGEKWGQSALPLSDLLPSNPLFQLSAAILTNTEPFTGKPIYNEVLDGSRQVAQKYLELAWRELAPSMAPGGYGWNKLKTGLMNMFRSEPVLDWADRPQELHTAILSSIFGIKLTPVSERELKRFELSTRKRIAREASKEIATLKRKFQKHEISQEEFEQQAKELLELQKRLLMEKQ